MSERVKIEFGVEFEPASFEVVGLMSGRYVTTKSGNWPYTYALVYGYGRGEFIGVAAQRKMLSKAEAKHVPAEYFK